MFARWLAQAGFDRVLLLPLGTMAPGETSPYSAASTLAIDPIYISMSAVPDFIRAGGVNALSPAAQGALDAVRRSDRVQYDLVRRVKDEALGLAFRSFLVEEWVSLTPRGAALAAFISRERAWLDDYALYHAIDAAHGHCGWRRWPDALRDREPAALDRARRELARDVLEEQYRQWVADTEWRATRRAASDVGVSVIGDLPFAAAAESPEVWAHSGEFDLEVSVGVPPDAFSPEGQDWGLPMYRWDVIRAGNFGWLAQRAARMAALFDGLRVDHVIGLYRTFGRRGGGQGFFSPPDETSQIAQGEAVLSTLAASGLGLIAEDLGVVPDFLRPSLERLGLPGCRVLRWERDWPAPGAPFLDPAVFPPLGAVMTGTHDTEPLAAWWGAAERNEREAFLQIDALKDVATADADWHSALRDAVLRVAYSAGADQLFLPIQDCFGWPDRVNVPGTVTPENWTWTLPWPVETWLDRTDTLERAAHLLQLAEATGRGGRAGRLLEATDATPVDRLA